VSSITFGYAKKIRINNEISGNFPPLALPQWVPATSMPKVDISALLQFGT
jgi:hypothetical protein